MTEHRIHLDAFDGPLDLLLYLIRRAEVEITDIPIAEIADQYLVHLSRSAHLDIDEAGEFLVMAATLMEIKSRVLTRASEAPRDDVNDPHRATEPDDDPRADLIRQLLAYKRHRDAADSLLERRAVWERRYPSARAAADRQSLLEAARDLAELDLGDLTVGDLASRYAAALRRVDLSRLGDHHVSIEDDDTPIELHQADILDRLATSGTLSLHDLFTGRRRVEVVGLFIALLELIRQRRLDVRQPADEHDDITLAPAIDEETHEKTPDAEAPSVRVQESALRPELQPGKSRPQ